MLHGSRGAVFSKRVPLAAGGKNASWLSLFLFYQKHKTCTKSVFSLYFRIYFERLKAIEQGGD